MDSGYDKCKEVLPELFAANVETFEALRAGEAHSRESSELGTSNRMFRRASREKREAIQAAVTGYEDYIININS